MATIKIEHDGVAYSGEVMEIKSTMLGYEDHGILTAYLFCERKGSGVGVGGFCLDVPAGDGSGFRREGTGYGLDHVIRLIETVGVSKWEQLPGKQVIVLSKGEGGWGSQSAGIANLLDDSKVLILQEHADSWREKASA